MPMLMRRAIAYSSFCAQVVLQGKPSPAISSHSLLKCSLHPKIADRQTDRITTAIFRKNEYFLRI